MSSVTVLLSTFNGEKYLEDQLNSLLNQSNVEMSIFVRDDGSSDNTVSILKRYADKGLLTYYVGDNKGPAYSFLDLIKNAPISDYYAFCDQDDIWDINKLSAALTLLDKYRNNKAILYCCGAKVINSNMQEIGKIETCTSYDYIDCLIHNNVLGCTMVYSHELHSLLKQYKGKHLFMHDDLTIKLCLAVGGTVVSDPNYYLTYRIHGNNVVGTKESFRHSFRRRIKSLFSQSCERSQELIDICENYEDIITTDNILPLRKIAYYKTNYLERIKVVFDYRLKANSIRTTIHFKIAVLLGFY